MDEKELPDWKLEELTPAGELAYANALLDDALHHASQGPDGPSWDYAHRQAERVMELIRGIQAEREKMAQRAMTQIIVNSVPAGGGGGQTVVEITQGGNGARPQQPETTPGGGGYLGRLPLSDMWEMAQERMKKKKPSEGL